MTCMLLMKHECADNICVIFSDSDCRPATLEDGGTGRGIVETAGNEADCEAVRQTDILADSSCQTLSALTCAVTAMLYRGPLGPQTGL